MLNERSARWLNFLEKRIGWIGIPNIAIIFVTLQGIGFFMVMSDPLWIGRLALIPSLVLEGQVWRLVTFLALPVSNSLLYALLSLYFLYFILNIIENEWGAFKTTFYTLVSIVVTISFSMGTGYPVTEVADFISTLFLASAALFPEMEVNLFFLLPVKMKWLAWLSLAFTAWKMIGGDWMDRFFLFAIYSNYLIFFGPTYISSVRQYVRRQQYRRKIGR